MELEERLNNMTTVIADIMRRSLDCTLYDQIKICDLICNHDFHGVGCGYSGYRGKYNEWEQCSICGILKPVGGWK